MQTNYTYASALAASQRINWRVEDIIGGEKRLDFDKPFMPEALARVARSTVPVGAREAAAEPDPRPRLSLPCSAWSRSSSCPSCSTTCARACAGDDARCRALLQFAGEEAKHIHLFKRFRARVQKGFSTRVRGDRPARGDRRGRAEARAAVGRAADPAYRMDDPAPLHREHPRRPGPRPAVREHAAASLDGGGPARHARHADGEASSPRACRRPRS